MGKRDTASNSLGKLIDNPQMFEYAEIITV